MHKAIKNALRPQTRRQMLKASGGAVALATGVGAAPVLADEPDPIFALIAEWEVTEKAAHDAAHQADVMELDARNNLTPFWVEYESGRGGRGAFSMRNALNDHIKYMRASAGRSNAPKEVLDVIDAHAAKLNKKADEIEAKREAEREALGIPQMRRKAGDLFTKADVLLGQIFDTPARSPEGIAAKLRIADHYEQYVQAAADPKSTYVAPRAIASALRDCEKLAVTG